MKTFASKLERLKTDLVEQGGRVMDMTLRAVESYVEGDARKAAEVIADDDEVDRADVEIERASIPLLAMGVTDEYSIRSILSYVKINNELERVADCAVDIAETVTGDDDGHEPTPPTFRVMANSVVGMLRDTCRALADSDTKLSEQVLAFDDTVDRFEREIFLAAEEQVASGELSARFAFRLHTVTKSLERIADHCTNICEQVIYLESGMVVRHLPQGWSKPAPPD